MTEPTHLLTVDGIKLGIGEHELCKLGWSEFPKGHSCEGSYALTTDSGDHVRTSVAMIAQGVVTQIVGHQLFCDGKVLFSSGPTDANRLTVLNALGFFPSDEDLHILKKEQPERIVFPAWGLVIQFSERFLCFIELAEAPIDLSYSVSFPDVVVDTMTGKIRLRVPME